jgi:hypothetical protein
MPNNEKRLKWKDVIFDLIKCCKHRKVHSSCCEIDIAAEPPTPTQTD